MYSTDLLVKEKTVYIDMLGNEYRNKDDAKRSNHDIHLKFREYIGSLIKNFVDGRVDMLGTTKNLWDKLIFTDDCIRSGCLSVDMKSFNEKKEPLFKLNFDERNLVGTSDIYVDCSNNNINIG